MNTGIYSACAGLLAQSQALDQAANNLANLNTNGYKMQKAAFRSLLADGETTDTDTLSEAVAEFGVLGEGHTDLRQGAMESTGSDFDFALQGEGWFAVQAAGGHLYTRNGNFHVDRSGQLVTADGNPVLGPQGVLTIPQGKLSVSGDGTMSVDGALAGQIQVVQFAPGTVLTPAGSSYFSAPVGNERPGAAQIVQGTLEASNVNAISAAVGLVAMQRHADFMQQALTAFHSNFNRIAAQDLSRI